MGNRDNERNHARVGLLQRLRLHLFLKILFVFVLTLATIIASSMITHRLFFKSRRFPVWQRNTISHAHYIIKEIGTPPDLEKAQKLARKLKIQIRYQDEQVNWASDQEVVDFPRLKLPAYSEEAGAFAGFADEGLCVILRQGSGRFLLVMQPREEGLSRVAESFLLITVFFATFLILGMYFVIRWLLKPIKVLREGVRQLSEGRLDYEMATNRSDELGQLIGSFNTMTRRIREMIEARERLLLDVSHELRSPLTRIKVALEFLEENSIRKNIQDDIAGMETMIAELLETERLNSPHGTLKLEKTNLMPLIRGVIEELREQKPGIHLLTSPKDVAVEIDRERIQILLRNILDNALRYSDPAGYPVEVSVREKCDEITIQVQDFGCGIPEKELPFIFEPFYRVDKSRSKKTGGYGLGMSLSKKIVETHGGTIHIQSRPGVGTTILLRFKR